MKAVPTLLQDNIHHRAAVVAILRRKAVVLYFEFLDDLNRRLVIDIGGCAFALLRRAGKSSVQPDLRRSVALTIGDKVRTGWVGIVCTLTRCLGYTTRQKYKSEHAAIGQGNVTH